MTHEHTGRVHAEHRGPEHDIELPDATSIPAYSNVLDSLAPPLIDARGYEPKTRYIGAEPGWWERAPYGEVSQHWLGDD